MGDKKAALMSGSDAEPDARVDEIEALLRALPQAYRIESGREVQTTMVIDVVGVGLFTLAVTEEEAQLHIGGHESPDGTLTFEDADAILTMAANEIDHEETYMAGRVKTDKMSVLMSFAKLFDLAKAWEITQEPGLGEEGTDLSGCGSEPTDAEPGPGEEAIGRQPTE